MGILDDVRKKIGYLRPVQSGRSSAESAYTENLNGSPKTNISEELDDEYLPACCRNGRPHYHPT